MTDRPVLDVPTPPGGWGAPWPNVAEIASAFPCDRWSLVGGLMAQLHGAHRGVDAVRPTDDVDIVLHVETTRRLPTAAARTLEGLGYQLLDPVDPRRPTAHRFRRGKQTVDLVAAGDDVVDVLVADHTAPRVVPLLRGRRLVAIEGGTQALRRTVLARLAILDDAPTTISTPSVFGALVLKAAAYRADSRNPARHLQDAAVLLACLDDPYEAVAHYAGSDRSRVLTLRRALPDDAPQWRALGAGHAREGQAALRVLANACS